MLGKSWDLKLVKMPKWQSGEYELGQKNTNIYIFDIILVKINHGKCNSLMENIMKCHGIYKRMVSIHPVKYVFNQQAWQINFIFTCRSR